MKKRIIPLAYVALLVVIAFVCYRLGTRNQRELRYRKVNVEIQDSDLDICYGADSAKLTIYMFATYTCKHCRNFMALDLPLIRKKYTDNGTVRFVIKPIEMSDDNDMLSALQLAVCLNQNGNFNDINDLLLSEPAAVYTEDFRALVDDIINGNQELSECLISDNYAYIKQNNELFDRLNSKGTPIFVINGHLYKGHRKIQQFLRIIDYELDRI